MPSIVTPSSSAAPRMRSASSPGSTIRARSEPSCRNRKQFSASWPTVNMRTSTGSALRLLSAAVALCLARLSLLLLLAEEALVHVAVQQIRHRDVEREAEGDRRQQRDERILAHQREHPDEQDRGQGALLGRARPARGLRLAGFALALLLGAAAGPVLRLGASTRPPAGRAGVDAPALGAAVLAAALLLGLRHRPPI